MPAETVPALEAAYRQHRGLLFRALGQLARQGFAVNPADAPDLVHDFFLEAWNGIAARFDPSKAALSTYVHGAFVQFARPRILRLQRLQGALVEPLILAQHAESAGPDQAPESAPDLSRVRDAIGSLDGPARHLLRSWLGGDGASERRLAQELGLSRHAVRLRLLDALGRVALALGALQDAAPLDRRVAIALWRDQLTPAEVATELGLQPQQLRNALGRIQHRMHDALDRLQTARGESARSITMSTQPADLIRDVAKHTDDDAVLAEVERHAPALVASLAEAGGAAPAAWQDLPDAWLGRVYEAIGRGLGDADGHVAHDPELDQALADDAGAIGRAFESCLVPSVPKGIDGLLSRLAGYANAQNAEALEASPDVAAGGNEARKLAATGVTPMHLLLAADAVGMLLERSIEAQHFSGERPIRIPVEEGKAASIVQGASKDLSWLDPDVLADTVRSATGLDADRSDAVLEWLLHASRFVPLLFGGFEATPTAEGLELVQRLDAAGDEDLYQRWRGAPVRVRFDLDEVLRQGALQAQQPLKRMNN
jgi:RNA polymerase sigma factor (sigma-70 family)